MKSITIGNTVVKYDVIKSDRKTLGIQVDPQKGVIVRSPKKVSEDKIQEVVKNKSKWILEKLDRVNEIKSKPAAKEFMSGEKLPYLGRRYRLKVKDIEDYKGVAVKFYQGKFIIKINSNLNNKEQKRRETIRNELIKWYREHAQEKIKERVNKYKEQIGVEPNNIKVKKQKKRWGSCSNKGNLNFNWKIIMAPMSVVDYIVIHELTHLKYSNHSKGFWKLIEAIIPNYKEKQEWLRINGPTLIF